MMNQDQVDTLNEPFTRCELIFDAYGRPIDYRFIYVNQPFVDAMRLDSEVVIGKTIREITNEDVEDIIDISVRAVTSNKAVTLEKHFYSLGKDFKVIAFSENPNEFCMIYIDLTELKQKIRFFEKYRLLFENSKNIIIFLKENGDILEANPVALKSYGYTINEITGLNIRDLRDSSSLNEFESQFQQAIKSGVFFESIHKRKDGSVFPVEVSSIASDFDENKIIMSIIRDISDRKKLESELIYLANHDFLTGVPNRTYVMNQFGAMCDNALMRHEQLAVLFFDIDKFKRINDTYGHEFGDVVLKEISKRIQSVVTGLFGRVGGDEFVILQPFISSKQEIITLVEHVIREFERLIIHNGVSVNVTTSIGISIFPKDSIDISKLLSYADNAMYDAKKLFGNSCRFYSDIVKQK
jgi:diguanylate cyclase (GGDEF)-like protein/PAS domain S-box-containing protein